MNLLSFVDELVKVGAVRCLSKRAADITMADTPSGMASGAAPPPAKRVAPDEAATRLATAHLPPAISPGMAAGFGSVVSSKEPIDQERFNRPFTERR